MGDKSKYRATIERTGFSEEELAKRAGVRSSSIRQALSHRTSQENAGAIAKALAEELSLSYAERRELFWELVTSPGQSVEDRRRYMKIHADGDPMEHLREAARNYRPPRD